MLHIRLAFLAMIAISSLRAQDPYFSQYNSAPLHLNPAFAGSTGQARAGVVFRDQWPNFRGNFVTTNISYDQHFPKLHGGLGLNFQNDIGTKSAVQTNGGDLSYAFHLPLFKNRFIIRPAVSMALIHTTVKYNSQNPGDFFEPRRGIRYPANPGGKNTVTNIDFGLGFVAYTKKFLFGFSSVHLTPNLNFLGDRPISQRTTIHSSLVIGHVPGDFANKISVIPQVVCMAQAGLRQVTGGVTVLYKYYTLGIAYRTNDALIFAGGFQNRLFRAAYSYDYTASGVNNKLTGGSHEISVQFFLFANRKPESFLAPVNALF